MAESDAQKSPCAQRFLRSSCSSGTQSPGSIVDSNVKKSNPKKILNASVHDKSVLASTVSNENTPRRICRPPSGNAKRSISTSTFTEFEKSCLKAHNECRLKHDVPPLKLNKKLCRFAEEWAKV